MEFFDDLCILITPIPRVLSRTSNSLPSYYNKNNRQKRRAPHSMYSTPQFMHSYYYGNSYGYPISSVHRYSQSTLGSCEYQNLPPYASSSYASSSQRQYFDINDTNKNFTDDDDVAFRNGSLPDSEDHYEQLKDSFLVNNYVVRDRMSFMKSCTTIAEEESLGDI